MCTTNIFTYVHPDGRKEQSRQPNLCPNSRNGRPCSSNAYFHHPPQYLSSSYSGTGASGSAYFPPTPTYTPRSSTPNAYRSGDESDRSYGSYRSASGFNSKRSSGIYVNVNSRPSKSQRDRVVVVDGPRTPPQNYSTPLSAPSSPALNNMSNSAKPYIVEASPRTSSSRPRPPLFDERPPTADRPRVQIEVVEPGSSKHSRRTSSSSHESRYSFSSSSAAGPKVSFDDSDRQRRRQEKQERDEKRREERRHEEKEIRNQRMRARIAQANAEIASRPVQPIPTTAPNLKRSSTYTRPAVEVPAASSSSMSFDERREAELADAVRRLELDGRRRRRGEDEAQRQRLMDRMAPPQRRATVTGGSSGARRHRSVYNEAGFRWD